ncbi:MAG: glycosyltransferase family 39 protein [Burkholderiaceae bacterium]|jgi:hypothetical protein
MSSHRPLPGVTFAVLFLVFFAVWFGALAPRHLAKTDEGRYAEIPREMVSSGDWITPRLDGLKYFEKPPLQYWATALAFEVFGPGEWTTRLWTGLSGFLGVVFVAYTARRLYGGVVGLYASAVLASAMLYFLMAHVATLDMGVTFFMTAGLCSTLLARQAEDGNVARGWMMLTWAFLALAVLSKGLEGIVLPGCVFVLYLVTTRDWALLKRVEPWRGGLLFLVISVPWFVWVSQRNPEFPHFFFIHEHFERFLTHEHHREGPIWYFIPILLVGFLPWTFVLPAALLNAWRETHLPSRGASGRFMPARLLLLWSGFIFVFFSLSGSKLPSYILPIFPALAILSGAYLAKAGARAVVLIGFACAVLGLALVGLGLEGPGWFVSVPPEGLADYSRFGYGLAIAGGIEFIGATASLVLVHQSRMTPAVLAIAAASFLAGCTGLLSYGALDRYASAYYVAQAIGEQADPTSHLYSVEMYDQTLPFYLGRPLTLVNQRDELDFGLHEEPALGIATLAEFASRWRTDPSAIAVMPPTTFDKLLAMKIPMRVILKDGRFVVVSKP